MLRNTVAAATSFYINHLPDHRGKARVVKVMMRAAGQTPVTSRYGVTLLANWQDATNVASVMGKYDDVFAVIDMIEPHTNFIDVGANAGVFSLVALRRLRGTGAVIAFEPSPDVFRMLIENARLNKAEGFFPFQAAIGKATGLASFDRGPVHHTGVAHLSESGDTRVLKLGPDALKPLLIPLLGDRSTVIKIDVEGAELEVLHNLRDFLLMQPSTKRLVVEIDIRNGVMNEVYGLMHASGFEFTKGLGAAPHYNEVFVRRTS